MKNAENKAGIIIPTKNRADFMIRLFNYYSRLESPYPLYISDASNDAEADKLQIAISKFESKLKIIYNRDTQNDSWQRMIYLFSIVKEPYVVYIGDDDYWIPDALNECIEFLEKNPDYETAIAKTVTFKTRDNKPFGELKEIHDYQRYSIEADRAHKRFLDYMGPHMTSIIGAVIKTDHVLQYYRDSYEVADHNIRGEILPSCYMVIAGKSKVINRLGFIRQIHDSHFQMADLFDWITSKEWYPSYSLFREKIVTAMMNKDQIDREKAEQIFKQGLWFYLQRYLPKYYNDYINSLNQNRLTPGKKSLRNNIGSLFPSVKRAYRRFIRPLITNKEQIHYEVTQPGSKYYKDFKPIIDSLTP